jgi:hypothetical protein
VLRRTHAIATYNKEESKLNSTPRFADLEVFTNTSVYFWLRKDFNYIICDPSKHGNKPTVSFSSLNQLLWLQSKNLLILIILVNRFLKHNKSPPKKELDDKLLHSSSNLAFIKLLLPRIASPNLAHIAFYALGLVLTYQDSLIAMCAKYGPNRGLKRNFRNYRPTKGKSSVGSQSMSTLC